jgi:hypothetical protein
LTKKKKKKVEKTGDGKHGCLNFQGSTKDLVEFAFFEDVIRSMRTLGTFAWFKKKRKEMR